MLPGRKTIDLMLYESQRVMKNFVNKPMRCFKIDDRNVDDHHYLTMSVIDTDTKFKEQT